MTMMNIIISTSLIVSIISLAVMQILKNKKYRGKKELREKISPVIMISSALVLLLRLICSWNFSSVSTMFMDLFPFVVAMWVLQSTFAEAKRMKWAVVGMIILGLTIFIVNLCMPAKSPELRLTVQPSIFILILIALAFYGIYAYLRAIKLFMKNGTVWTTICLIVDMAYLFFIFMSYLSIQLGLALLGLILCCGILFGESIRIMRKSAFIIWRKQERIIVESMKIATSSVDESRIDNIYKEIYDRIVNYFEEEKPYLSGELTIDTVVKKLYTNKVYISRAISQYTGRNFRQFVNYYRVMYTVEVFRRNPEMRVQDLVALSGFNSVVSYDMAFKLFMGETPGEWIRKERAKIVKKK